MTTITYPLTRKAAAAFARAQGIQWDVQENGSVWLNLWPHEDQAQGQAAISDALEAHLQERSLDSLDALLAALDDSAHIGGRTRGPGGAPEIVVSLLDAAAAEQYLATR